MNKRVLLLLMSLLCGNAVVAAQSKRTISIEEIASEFGIVFVEKRQRGLISGETRAVPMQTPSVAERELLIELGKRLLAIGGQVFKDGRLRRMLLPHQQTALSPKAERQIREAVQLLDGQDLPPEFIKTQHLILPDFLIGLLDFAHSLMGMVDEKIVPAVRAYLRDFMLGEHEKHVRFTK